MFYELYKSSMDYMMNFNRNVHFETQTSVKTQPVPYPLPSQPPALREPWFWCLVHHRLLLPAVEFHINGTIHSAVRKDLFQHGVF